MMMKKAILTMGVLASAIAANAQKVCATDEFYQEQKARFAGIEVQEAKLQAELERAKSGRVSSPFAKTTADDNLEWDQDTRQFHIPVVVHVIYDYAASDATAPSNNVTDAQIESSIDQLNAYFNRQALNLNGIITPFVPYIGNARISFHLAGKDPAGKPTRGIVRTYSYQATGGDEAAKINPWSPDKYLNIYLIYKIGRGASQGIVLAYATFPTSYADNPFSQGVISRVDQVFNTTSSTLAHEVGHYLFLYHPWNNNNAAVEEGRCGDDEVDDTPPTIGHFSCGPAKLYDTMCATGYYRDYDSSTYKIMTGISIPNIVAATSLGDTSLLFNDSLNRGLGQTFVTGNRNVVLQDISLYVDTFSARSGLTKMLIYNAAGTTLIARSSNNATAFPSAKLTYGFNGVKLAANTTYKFVLDSVGTRHMSFRVKASKGSSYANGTAFIDSGARNSYAASDLQFEVRQLRRIDYPDTTNTQNVMDYSDCNAQMFTRGQVARMRGAMRSDVGFRANLTSAKNLMETGVWDSTADAPIARPDLPPTALFSQNRFFVCADNTTPVTFTNRSYNATVTGASWTVSNGTPSSSTSTNSTSVTYSTPGWSDVSLTATGSVGSNTITVKNAVYAANTTGVDPSGYYQEFNEGQDLDQYPMFNYYNLNDYKWETFDGAGYYDRTSVRFRNFDTRASATIGNATLQPSGSYADLFTRAFNLGSMGGGSMCNLSFYTAGAFRTNRLSQMTDTLEIAALSNCSGNWFTIAKISGGNLGNNGLVETPFVPGYMGNWKEQSINVPQAYRVNGVFFRFRFRPGTNIPGYTGAAYGTGNHFYMDRFRISDAGLGVENGVIVSLGMTVSPNPTSGAATISINGGDNSTADITVTDVTGKLVFSTTVKRNAATTRIEVPATAIAVKGMYLVKVVTGGATQTQKLVVY